LRGCALFALLLAACDLGPIDPCDGKSGACVGVHLDSDATPLDQIRITLDRRADAVQLTPASPATLSLPVRFAVQLPAGTTSAHLDFEGLDAGKLRASAAVDATVPSSIDVQLSARGPGDGGDSDAADLSDVDAEPPDLFGTVPLTITYSGNGTGQITANGQSCAAPGCTLSFLPGTMVNMLAAADAPVSIFNNWSGACNGTANSCAFTINAATDIDGNFHRIYRNLTVYPTGLGGGAGGAVTPNPVGITCGTNCWSYPVSTQVTLTETPTGTSSFAGWGAGTGLCTLGTGTCKVTMTNDAALIPTFTNATPNYVFITSATYAGAVLLTNPQNVADTNCQTLATAQSLPNPSSYKAWLGSGVTASSKLGSARGWVRMDGLPFADTVASLTSGNVLYPIALNETNAAASGTPWTGANADGTIANNCTNFTVTTGNATGGEPLGGARTWSSGAAPACNSSQPLICFGTASQVTISLTAPSVARIAFLSQGNYTPGTTDGKKLCNDEAALASLSGTFRPFLATVGASGLSGFDIIKLGPWARRDGVLLTTLPNLLDFSNTGTRQLAPLDRFANGNPVGLTGSAYTGQGGSDTCLDWSSNMNSINGATTSFNTVAATGVTTCDVPLPVYCLQE
jgi:hypothetical protein